MWARSGKSLLCLYLHLLWDKPTSSVRHEFIEHVPWAGYWEMILDESDTPLIQELMAQEGKAIVNVESQD